MSELLKPTNRRTVLQRGLAVLAGVVGMRAAAPEVQAESASPPAPPAPPPIEGRTIRFYARRLHMCSQGQRPGELPAWNGRGNCQSDLFESPRGKKVGEFYATSFGPDAPARAGGSTAGRLELQTIRVEGGVLLGVGCPGLGADPAKTHAILGGTGCFAGATGSYVIREQSEGIEFVLTLK